MTYSEKYSQFKKDEFYKQLAQTLTNLESKQVKSTVYGMIIDNFITYIRSLDELEFKRMVILPKTLLMKKMDKFFKRLNYVLMFKFRKLLTSLWADTYQLGINHQVQDMLYVTKLFSTFDKNMTKVKFSSMLNDSLVEHITGVAEFAAGDDEETISNIKAIGRARRNLTILQKNVNKLRAEENLFSPTKLQGSEDKASRLSIQQRIEFLRAVQEISDFSKKAEASKKSFLGDNYLQQRIRVLGADYASGYDTYIKEQLAEYVNQNIEGVRQIRKNKARATVLRQQITSQIEAQNVDDKTVEPVIKARNILRTELSIAYNFGKLAGFTSTMDETRKVRWNADWELESARDRITKKVINPSNYEVCKACARMDGRVFTVRELLIIGTRLDRGILKHGSNERTTDFKNPSMPMVPFHPNCYPSCVIIRVENNEDKKIDLIEIGDKVYVPTSSKYERVTKTHKNWYADKLYRLKFNNGSEVISTRNHPFWVNNEWREAERITVGDILYTFSNIDERKYESNIRFVPKNSEQRKSSSHSTRDKQSNSNENCQTIEYKSNSTRSINRTEQNRQTTSNLLGTNESQQSNVYDWCGDKSKRFENDKWIAASSLQIQNRKRSLQNRLQRRYKLLRSQFLGSQCKSNTQQASNQMEVRETNQTIRWAYISNRFLSARLGCLYRSKGLLDRRWKTEIQSISSGISSTNSNVSGQSVLQGANQEFQGLVPVRVESIETYVEPQYVYNLTVENAEVYFANGILGHNCACYWTVEPLESEEETLQEAAELPTMPSQAYEPGQLPGAVQEVQRISDNTLPVLLGTGLLVGGLFLMARSNVWKSFFRTVQKVESAAPPPKIIETATDIVGDVARVGRTIKIEIKNPQLFEEFEDVVINTIATGTGVR